MCPPLLATPITNERGERLPFPYSVQTHAETHSRLSDSISLRGLSDYFIFWSWRYSAFEKRVGMAASGIEFHRRWIEQCEAAQRIKQRFGLSNALEYLVGEKLLHFVEAAEHHPEFAQELPYFVAEIRRVFSLAEVGNYAVHIERTKPLSMPQRAAIRAISSISGQIH
jgi:hypothetical protein